MTDEEIPDNIGTCFVFLSGRSLPFFFGDDFHLSFSCVSDNSGDFIQIFGPQA